MVLETQGDLKSAEDRRDEAKPLWQEALKTVQEAPDGCFATETEQRLLDKLKDAEPGSGGGGGGGQGEGGGEGGGGGQGGGEGQGEGQGEAPADGQGQGQGEGEGGAPAPGQDQGQGQGQDGGQGQAPANLGDPAPDTVGADRIATDSGGSVHELKPREGDPDDVLKRLLEDSAATGVDRE